LVGYNVHLSNHIPVVIKSKTGCVGHPLDGPQELVEAALFDGFLFGCLDFGIELWIAYRLR
jgi:hypothetical protein